MHLTAGQFLFLGDYVDRGKNGIEVVAYLFANKLLNPKKVFLLRGNHETRSVNGWHEYYGERAFITQCVSRFGNRGHEVWEAINKVFDVMPLAATIDNSIFCVHGGIPRPVSLKGIFLESCTYSQNSVFLIYTGNFVGRSNDRAGFSGK